MNTMKASAALSGATPVAAKAAEPHRITGRMLAARIWRGLVLVLLTLFLSLNVQAQSTTINWSAPEYTGMGVGDFVRACRLANGNWLCCFTIGTDYYRVYVWQSTNNCLTFSPLATISLESENRNFWNPNMIQKPNGDVLLVGHAWVPAPPGHNAQDHQIRLFKSTNMGASWVGLSTVDSCVLAGPSGEAGLWEPALHFASDGRLVCLYSDETYQPSFSQVISEKISSDYGATWGSKSHAVSDWTNPANRPGMPIVTRMADGRYMMAYEIAPTIGAAQKISNDGLSWPAGLGTVVPDQHTAPFVCAMPDGRVFYTSGDGNTKVSYDYGGSWQDVPSPIHQSLTYPAIYLSKPDEMVWFMGRRDSNGVSVWRGAITYAPITLSNPRESHLRLSDGRMMTFACSYPNGAVSNRVENTPGGSWGPWLSVGNSSAGFRRVEGIQWTDGTLHAFGVGENSAVWMISQTSSNGPWQASWSSLVDGLGQGGSFREFKAFKYYDGRCAVFAWDGKFNSQIWVRFQNGNSGPWGNWSAIAGNSGITSVSPILLPDNRFLVNVVGNMTPVWRAYQTSFGGSWSTWAAVGGTGAKYNAVRTFRYNDGRLCVVAGDGNQMATCAQSATNVDFTNWGTWQTLPGYLITQFDPILQANQRFSILAVQGADGGNIRQSTQTSVGGSWGNWSNLGGAGFYRVDGGQLPDGRLYYFGNGLGSPEWLRYQQTAGGSWYSNWTNLSGSIF